MATFVIFEKWRKGGQLWMVGVWIMIMFTSKHLFLKKKTIVDYLIPLGGNQREKIFSNNFDNF